MAGAPEVPNYSGPVLVALHHGATWIDGSSKRAACKASEYVVVLINAAYGTFHASCKQPKWTMPLKHHDGYVFDDDLARGAHALLVFRPLTLATATLEIPATEVEEALRWLNAIATLANVTGQEPAIGPVVDLWWRVAIPQTDQTWVSARLGAVGLLPDSSATGEIEVVDVPGLEVLRSKLVSPDDLERWYNRNLVGATAPQVDGKVQS